MLLSNLLTKLALGELSQHRFGTSGEISTKDKPVIISHLNSVLTVLHARFALKEKELIIYQHETVYDYKLDYAHASSNSTSTKLKYILDSVAEPFLDDIIRIESAYNSEGTQVGLNSEFAKGSWFTPTPDSLQVPFPVTGNLCVLMYRANHVEIPLDAALDTEIDVPRILEKAIQAYIAAECFVSLGNQSSAGLSAYYNNRYQKELALIKYESLLETSSGDSNIKLSMKGFV